MSHGSTEDREQISLVTFRPEEKLAVLVDDEIIRLYQNCNDSGHAGRTESSFCQKSDCRT